MSRNANIKSKKEALTRLMNGEVFYYEGTKICYNEGRVQPFRSGAEPLHYNLDEYKNWQTKQNWDENIPEQGILCWVSGTDKLEKDLATIVTYSDGKIYRDSYACEWEYATPLTKEEALKYILGE